MEIDLINRQDVAEPDQTASGVTGTGQKNERKTGIVEYRMRENSGVFSRHDGCTGTLPAEQVPGEFFPPQNPTQKSGNPPGSISGYTPVSQEKTRKKNRIVLGLGVLYNGGTKPAAPGAIPVSCPGAGVLGNSTITPTDPGPDPCERLGDFIFSCYERQERIYDRLDRKIGRLDQRLDKLEARRKEKRDERRWP
jgi:hypothetical protein